MRQSKRASGFTLVELMVAISMVLILSLTAYGNYTRYRLIAYDSSAQSDVRNAMVAVQSESIAEEGGPNFFMTRIGPNNFPAPLDHLNISKNVRLTVAKWDFSGTIGSNTYNYQYYYSYGYHSGGCHIFYKLLYRFVFNGQESILNYDYKLPYFGAPAAC